MFFLLAVVLLTFSCSESEEIPEGILSQDKMVSILIDIRIAEGKVGSLSVSKDSARTLFQELQRRAFEKHDLDSAIYRKSYQYYILNPQRYLEGQRHCIGQP